MTGFRERSEVRDAAAVPHITVKARSGLGPDLAWVPAARAVAEHWAPVEVSLGGPEVFGNGSALYLGVRSPGAVALHLALLEALKPAGRFGSERFRYEGPGMTPHLTLALARRGVAPAALLPVARQAFADLESAPLTFTARTLTLMRKPGPGGAYAPLEEWALGG